MPGFSLGKLEGSCSSSEEQLYSCSPGSDSSVYFDALPYLDFHLPERKLNSRDCSPECLRKGYHVSLVPQKPVRPVSTSEKAEKQINNFLADRYLARAAKLVAELRLDDTQESPKKTDETKIKNADNKSVKSSDRTNDELDDCEEFILFYDEKENKNYKNDEKLNNNDANFNFDESFHEEKEKKLRRASSLKAPKANQSAGERKIVRFADALGLDLADVRTFLDEVPKVPKSAYSDLHGVEIAPSPVGSFSDSYMSPVRNEKSIVPLFDQPFSSKDFMERLRSNSICLESASVTDPTLFMITGVVRVVNLGFYKEVTVRYSDDSWVTHTDLQARYLPNSCDGFSDKFSFVLFANGLDVGKRLEFALRYKVNDSEFWDSNNGANYSFQCVPNGIPRPASNYEPSPLTFGSSFTGGFY